MPATSSTARMIRLDPASVAGRAAPVASVIDIDAPRDGIVCEADRFLGIDLRSSCSASDHWIRGRDVIAIYEPDDPRHVRATALWRLRDIPGVAIWELIASATTSRPQSDASLAVVSDVAAAEIMWGCVGGDGLQWQQAESTGADCVLIRHPDAAGGSVFLAVHPADSRGFVVRRAGDRTRVECWLFSAAAEKGVLFRGRAMAALGPTADDQGWATRLWHDFITAPPMLTS